MFATQSGATAADVRIVVDWNPPEARYRPKHRTSCANEPHHEARAVAVIGASRRDGQIGNSVMKNLITAATKERSIRSIHPRRDPWYEAYKSVKEVPGDIDVAVFAIPASSSPPRWSNAGEEKSGAG